MCREHSGDQRGRGWVGQYADLVPLIPFPPSPADAPLVHSALDGTPASRWINPAHITSMVPSTRERDFRAELTVSVKLQGMAEDRWHLGTYDDLAAADAAWGQFIAYVSANS